MILLGGKLRCCQLPSMKSVDIKKKSTSGMGMGMGMGEGGGGRMEKEVELDSFHTAEATAFHSDPLSHHCCWHPVLPALLPA